MAITDAGYFDIKQKIFNGKRQEALSVLTCTLIGRRTSLIRPLAQFLEFGQSPGSTPSKQITKSTRKISFRDMHKVNTIIILKD